MGYPKGNQYYKLALNKMGRKLRFSTPEDLRKAGLDYFEWLEENPLYEHKAFGYTGKVVVEQLPVVRAASMSQFANFSGMSVSGWLTFRKSMKAKAAKGETGADEFVEIIDGIENLIWNQKFQAAAGNLLNANIISRELGLVDKQQVDETSAITWVEQKTYATPEQSVKEESKQSAKDTIKQNKTIKKIVRRK